MTQEQREAEEAVAKELGEPVAHLQGYKPFEAAVRREVENRKLTAKLRAYERAVEHKCRPIGRALMGEGRDWWVGELLEPVKDWPQESHCLHMKTPVKDVVFLCNSGDFSNLLVLCHVVLGAKLNQDWIETQMKIMRGKHLKELENLT